MAGCGHSGTRAGCGRQWGLTKGTCAAGGDAGHKQGKAQLLGLTATMAQGLADAAPAVGGSADAGRDYWWLTGPGHWHCSRLGVEAGDGSRGSGGWGFWKCE